MNYRICHPNRRALQGFYLSSMTTAFLAICFSQLSLAQSSQQPSSTFYEEWRTTPSPANGTVPEMNPSPFLWPSERHWKGEEVWYQVYVSRDSVFKTRSTYVSEKLKYCFYNLHKPLAFGTWYWKYAILKDNQVVDSRGPFAFSVTKDAYVFTSPSFQEFLNAIKKTHPRVMNQGKDMTTIRKMAPHHPLYNTIVAEAHKAMASPIYEGPVSDKDPAKDKALSILTGKEVGRFTKILEGYVLSGDKDMLASLLKRMMVLLQWPTNDLLGSQVLTSLAMGYDALVNELSKPVKQQLLNVIENRLSVGLKNWQGDIETRQVENHFWQMEIAGNFIASLATVDELPVSKQMLEYTYGLFLARFPNLSTQQGGWAEGIGYFGVNKSAIVDMALLMKSVGGCDVFKMNWYKTLADYLFYFAPVDGRIQGFGDMHDRVGNGNVGHSMMLIVANENQDQRALYRLATLLKAKRPMGEAEDWYEKELSLIEPWYQIIHDVHLDLNTKNPPAMEQAKLFPGVGDAALHTDVLHSEHNTAVYFRSSPFGAKGHMHASQNCFNISRRGDPIFYSSGYYTTFADPHSLTSYRHTRAHNGILVNGMGQAFGHEGYGWIKRFINGTKISYVMGDATMAYKPVVDQQFLTLLAENGILATPQNGFGDARLRLFERHLILLRQDIVVIYDILEAEEPSQWAFLLHSPEKPALANQGLKLSTAKNDVRGTVLASTKIEGTLTDQFHSPPIDIRKKYKSLPNQYHIRFESVEKTKSMRFLAIFQLSDSGRAVPSVAMSNNQFLIGDIRLQAELNTQLPPSLTVITKGEQLYVNKDFSERSGFTYDPSISTLLLETDEGKKTVTKSRNQLPGQYKP
ncbi:DUF4962 domain-containing protein [Chryseolinea lacunae]|uniref:DUF4962 domain-containing protein n=1 Tax=Chryseolinea lacunae TaxID=2801331 RepID=A0ABS1L289_9BACT|nr:DUF4962 domain-containing protein [Chryseolinea lacunae]MBL0745800.1 DUF4962 domain-containing protein [Chryseolinea lacunae]